MKGRLLGKRGKGDKVLEIGIVRDVLEKVRVGKLEVGVDDEGW